MRELFMNKMLRKL